MSVTTRTGGGAIDRPEIGRRVNSEIGRTAPDRWDSGWAAALQVDATLVGRKVELVFSPFGLETIDVRHQDQCCGKILPHNITRHTCPVAGAGTRS